MTDIGAHWLEAIDLAARGGYAAAESRLIELASAPAPWPSLALSSRASHRRQVGALAEAAAMDDEALLLASDAVSRADASIGCAADAVAAGRGDAARQWLASARADAQEDWRTLTRWRWVNAELALLDGDRHSAVESARCAEAICRGRSSRHEAKSAIIVAAASGDASHLVAVEEVVRRGGWATLQWPLALVAADHPRALSSQWLAEAWQAGRDAVAIIDSALPEDLGSAWHRHPGAQRLRGSREPRGGG